MTAFRLRVLMVAAALVAGACGGAAEEKAASTTRPSNTAAAPLAPSTTSPTSDGLQLDLRGLGPVRVGMTVDAATQALGRRLEPVTAPTDECTLYAPASGFDGIAFLVARGVVARVDVTAGATATTEGVAIGQTEAQAQAHYGGSLVSSPHDFLLGGRYLTLVPTGADAGFRLVAETDGDRVTALRAGRLPEVQLTEGCS